MTQVLHREAGSLPHDLTSFVGRRHATLAVKRALSESRLVTLTGVGGVGKSRLALHVARDVRRAFPDGARLVELAKIQDASLVAQAVAAALDLRDQSVRDPETVLVDYLADKRMLLVVDNCEHVLAACSMLVNRLLSAAPGLRVLATSRQPLGIGAEHVWPVPPLSVPAFDGSDPDQPSLLEQPSRQHEAITLFADRAAAVLPGFTLTKGNEAVVARLCQRLDGVPLAIELAAVRLRALTPEQILARLEDRFRLLTAGNRAALPRHQTLHAAVEWSFDLCSPPERLLWARCSVFAGEFDLDAAEDVCAGGDLTADEVFTCVSELVDKSILSREEHGSQVRYRLLETLRQYGQRKLAESGDMDALRARHRDYYLRLAERCEAESCGPRQAYWAEHVRDDRANFWAALDYCMTTPGEARTGLRLSAALWFYWIACGFVRDGRHWLDRALALDTAPTLERTRALWINGWIAYLQGDNAGSLTLTRESRELAAALGDETELAYATQFLGTAEMYSNNLPRAVELLEQALAHFRRSREWTAPALLVFTRCAQAAGLLGDVNHAVALRDECGAICASRGERWVWSWTEWNLSVTWWAAGEPQKAREHAQESLRNKAALNDQLGIPFCVDLLGWVAAADSDARRAAVLFGSAERMWQRIGRPLFGFELLLDWSKEARGRSRDALGTDAFEAACREGSGMTQQDVVAFALGDKPAAPAATTPAPRSSEPAPVLTKREREVAALVAAGKSNKEIAASLVISQRTAESHIEHILTKLGFNSRTQIAAWVAE